MAGKKVDISLVNIFNGRPHPLSGRIERDPSGNNFRNPPGGGGPGPVIQGGGGVNDGGNAGAPERPGYRGIDPNQFLKTGQWNPNPQRDPLKHLAWWAANGWDYNEKTGKFVHNPKKGDPVGPQDQLDGRPAPGDGRTHPGAGGGPDTGLLQRFTPRTGGLGPQGGGGHPGGGGGGGGGNGDGGGLPGTGGGNDQGGDGGNTQYAAYAKPYLKMIRGWGIPITENMKALVRKGYVSHWDSATLIENLKDTAAYKNAFPGGNGGGGSSSGGSSSGGGVSAGSYQANRSQYEAAAHHYGINLTKDMVGWLVKHDVTGGEFADRAEALSRLNRDKFLYASFRRELIQAGEDPKKVNSREEMLKYVMGDGNRKWYDLWQDAVTRNTARMAGLTFQKHKLKGGYTNLSQAVIEHISSLGLSESEMEAKFSQVEQSLRKILPMQEGVNKKEIIAATFGGKGASAARGEIERAVATDAAFYEGRATSSVYNDDQGHTVTQGVTDMTRKAQSNG